MNSNSELHLLIDWTCYFNPLTIDKPLQIIDKIQIKKLNNKIQTISRFYNVHVNDFRGNTDFNVYIIKDNNPIYDYRPTSKGNRKVNINMFDLKSSLRTITGSHNIHATDNIQETKDNLMVLGLYNKYYKQKSFSSLNDVFLTLNQHTDLKWVITHNFDKFIDGDDIDFLTNDYFHFMNVLDTVEKPKGERQNSISNGGTSVRNYIKVNNKDIPIDIRYVGDNFYDSKFQNDILNSRIKHTNGFFIPNPDMHLYSLIYHAIIHKPNISNEYINVFKQYGLNDNDINKPNLKSTLDIFMQNDNSKYCKPGNFVGFFL